MRIGVAHALTELALAEPVDAMRQEFPGVAVRLHTGWSRDLLERVRRGALGASVILLFERNGAPSAVAAHKLASEHLAIVAPRSWPSRSYPMRELASMGWILNPEGCAARAELERQLARAQLPLRVSVETYNYELQLRLIARGRGLGLVPNRLLLRSPSREKLRKLRVRGLSFPMTVWLVAGELSPGLEPALGALQRVLTGHLSTASLGSRRRTVSKKGKKRS
jgi:DNA-binding transcriptional LysR family regulator